MPEWCQAGRRAHLGGLWTIPCTEPDNQRRHMIGAPGLMIEPIELCDKHFEQVNRMGLVDEPYIEPEDFERRHERDA